MAKTIYPLVTNEHVYDYLINNLELIDDDNSMTDDEVDAVVACIVAKSTEGRLFEMVRDALMGNRYFEKVLDIVDDCMYDFVNECLTKED